MSLKNTKSDSFAGLGVAQSDSTEDFSEIPEGVQGVLFDQRDLNYRYNEDKFLAEVVDYVASTYQGHYVGGGQYQTVDIWNTLGSASTTCRDIAIKYLMRYGKKGGNNKKDLLKAIHYIILLNHFTQE